MQWTHLQHCQAPFPSWCPGSTPAQVPCAWRPSKMVRMSFFVFHLSFYLSIFPTLCFQSISLIANLVDYLAASLDDHLSGEHPLDCVAKLHIRWSGHSGGFLFRLLLFIRLSIMWVEREIYCWKRKLKFVETNFLQNPNFSHLGAFKSHDHNSD